MSAPHRPSQPAPDYASDPDRPRAGNQALARLPVFDQGNRELVSTETAAALELSAVGRPIAVLVERPLPACSAVSGIQPSAHSTRNVIDGRARATLPQAKGAERSDDEDDSEDNVEHVSLDSALVGVVVSGTTRRFPDPAPGRT